MAVETSGAQGEHPVQNFAYAAPVEGEVMQVGDDRVSRLSIWFNGKTHRDSKKERERKGQDTTNNIDRSRVFECFSRLPQPVRATLAVGLGIVAVGTVVRQISPDQVAIGQHQKADSSVPLKLVPAEGAYRKIIIRGADEVVAYDNKVLQSKYQIASDVFEKATVDTFINPTTHRTEEIKITVETKNALFDKKEEITLDQKLTNPQGTIYNNLTITGTPLELNQLTPSSLDSVMGATSIFPLNTPQGNEFFSNAPKINSLITLTQEQGQFPTTSNNKSIDK